jgi:hypothetical protein
MIGLTGLKRVIALVMAVSVGVVALLAVRQLADAVLRSASGADPTTAFNEIAPVPAELLAAVEWLSDPPRDGRTMEPTTRDQITDAWARALAALDRAGRGDAAAPLADYLSGPALDAAQVVATASDRLPTATFHVRQQLRLDFYSDDGSVVAIRVPAAEVVRVLGDPRTGVRVVVSDEVWRFVMVLQDGNWRVDQLELVASNPVDADQSIRHFDADLDGVNAVTVHGGDPTWRQFDRAEAIEDLDAAASLGFDTIRVFIAGPEFGPTDVAAVRELLDLAAEREIGVVPVLFDGSADHSPGRWRVDRSYLVLGAGAIAAHPAIALWDIKNEPDLDDARSGGAVFVDAWLARAIADLRLLDADTPITVGWSEARHAQRVAGSVDVVSFHHFGSAEALADAIEVLVGAAGGRPVLVSEYGVPAWRGFLRGELPGRQAQALAELRAVVDAGPAAGLVWQLRDPSSALEPGLAGGRASVSYGLFRADRIERPAVEVIRTGQSSPIPIGERIRELLPSVAAIGALIAALLGTWSFHRRGRRMDAELIES